MMMLISKPVLGKTMISCDHVVSAVILSFFYSKEEEEEESNKRQQEKKQNKTKTQQKTFKILMYVTMHIVRLCIRKNGYS